MVNIRKDQAVESKINRELDRARENAVELRAEVGVLKEQVRAVTLERDACQDALADKDADL